MNWQWAAKHFNELEGAWQTPSTPTLGGVTVGNGTVDASYHVMGNVTLVRVVFTLGGTSAITGPISFTLDTPATGTATGSAVYTQTGTKRWSGTVYISGSTATL